MAYKKRLKRYFEYFSRIFYWASGANIKILNTVPSEKNKYFGIGGTVIFTALMATLAGGYAFFTAFKSEWAAVFFGIFWGALIFNLDRYIVTTFGSGDGKKTISGQELIEAAPRLLMAIVLGIVIATPLELKLFEREINAEIATEIAVAKRTNRERGQTDPIIVNLQNQKEDLKKNIKNRNEIIDEKHDYWVNANKDKNDEWYHGKFSGKKGRGETYNDLKDRADEAQKVYLATKEEYSALNERDYNKISKIDDELEDQRSKSIKEAEDVNTIFEQNNGLLARLRAMDSLTSESPSLLFARWLITALFILIEIAPILFKMMTERGPYDDILDRLKHEVKVQELMEQSNINQNVNAAVKINLEKNNQKLEAELLANEEMLKSIAKAQSEIAQEAIKAWKLEQIQDVKQNPQKYINKNQ